MSEDPQRCRAGPEEPGQKGGTSPEHSGRRRRWIWGSLLAALGVAALAVFLPALLSTFGGRHWFAGTLATRLEADVNIDSLSLSWTSQQKIEGLSVDGSRGSPVGGEGSLFSVERAVIRTNLFDLIFTKEPLDVEIVGARLSLQRHFDGSFNSAGVFGTGGSVAAIESPVAEEQSPAAAGFLAVEKVIRSPRLSGWIPDFGRQVLVELRDARIELDDRHLGSLVAFTALRGTLRIGQEESSLELATRAETHTGDSRRSTGQVEGRFVASGWETPLADLELDGSVRIVALDLTPYSPILREYTKCTLPEDVVDVEVRANAAKGLLKVSMDIDAGVVGIAGARCDIPLGPSDKPAQATIPCAADLVPTLDLVRDVLGLSRDSRLAGDVNGTLTARAPLSVVEICDEGWAAFEGFEFRFDAQSENLVLQVPLGGGSPDVITGTSGADSTGCAFSVSGRLTGFEGSHLLPPPFVRVRGEMELRGDFRCGDVNADRVATSFTVTGGKLEFSSTRVAVNGGELHSRQAVLDLESVPPVYEIDVGVEGVGASYEISTLLAYVLPFLRLDERHGQLKGSIDGNVRLAGRGFRIDECERHLLGKGSLKLRNGHVRGSRVFERIADAFGRSHDLLHFEQMDARFDIGDGKIRSADVFLQRDKYSGARNLGFEGSTSFGARIDHSVAPAALEATVGQRDVSFSLPAKDGALASKGLPLRLSGTLSNPRVLFDRTPGESFPPEDIFEQPLESE